MRRSLALACTVALGATLAVPVAAAPATPDAAGLEEATATSLATGVVRDRLKDAEDGVFIVRLADAPVAAYDGGEPGLARTRPDTARGQRLDPDSPAVRAYQRHLEQQRDRAVAAMERRIARDLDVLYVYDFVLNGFAAELTVEEARELAALPEVVDIEPDELLELHTDNGPGWIGAPAVWGAGDDPDVGTRGEGVVVGIIDTGINPSNPSFADPGPIDGYEHTNPNGAGTYLGVCDPEQPAYDPTFACNDKLVGAWDFVLAQTDPNNEARDVDGHGSHTAGTVAGNLVEATVTSPATPGLSFDRTISGVAPHANIVSYRACAAGCPLSATNASINQAVADGVHVINYSIGGGSNDPWSNTNALAFLNARQAGVFVATSAGNSGPGQRTVGSPADAPWLLSVGASTHDRNISNTLTDLTSTAGTFGDLVGKGFSGGFGPAPIVDAADYGDALCLEPFPAGTFDGEIVVCDRGVIARVAKGANVGAGGAGGMILHNDAPSGATLNSDAHVIPAVHVSYADGNALKAWLAEGEDHSGTITGFVGVDEDPSWGDLTASFSSRGPNAQIDIISPNITAPGLDIIAAYGVGDPQPPVWDIVSGTSMSGPHAAGAGALLAALHPDWSPDEIQAALMTTAVTSGLLKEDATTPADWFDVGAGRIDLAAASQAGLVLHETGTNYLAADPAEGGDPRSLNLPNLANGECLGTCSWTRTVTATTAASWQASTSGPDGLGLSVTPSSFSLAAGESVALTVTADVSAAEDGSWLFGDVVFTSDAAPRAHFPVAVVPTSGVLPGIVDLDTRRDAGSQLVTGLEARPSPELTVDVHGLTRATLHEGEVAQDPNNGTPYAPIDAVWWETFEVPDGAVRLVAEILETPAPDLDLFIGTGSTPSAATQVCSGTTPASLERCDLDDPAAGTWWVLVQAWQASGDDPDPFTLSVGVVPDSDEGTMSVDAPATVDEGEPFDVRVFWDAEMEVGDRWYGAFSLGSSPAARGDIGRVAVDLVRHDDDVAKTADVETAAPGDLVTYELVVRPNVTPEDLVYTLTDTIPDGLTYVEGSVTGGATVEDGVLSWTGTMPTAVGVEGDYVMATNGTDDTCAVPFGDGGYVDLAAFGIQPQPGVVGDTRVFSAFAAGSPFSFYGRDHVGLGFTDDGFAILDPAANYGGSPWLAQAVPNPAQPNALIAALWDDFEIVHDAANNQGVALATTGGTGASGLAVVDYRKLQPWGQPDAPTSDVQLWVRRQPVPGAWDIAIAYNDLGSLAGPLTIGVENAAGTHGTALVNAASAEGVIDGDTVVCFRYEGPTFESHVITYQTTVDDGAFGELTNEVVHDTDDPGSQPAVASYTVTGPPPGVTAIDVTPAGVRLRVDATQQLTATATLANGVTVDVTDDVAWASTNELVATVDDTGLVRGVGGGTATVTASLGSLEASASVRVTGRAAEPGPPPRPSPPRP